MKCHSYEKRHIVSTQLGKWIGRHTDDGNNKSTGKLVSPSTVSVRFSLIETFFSRKNVQSLLKSTRLVHIGQCYLSIVPRIVVHVNDKNERKSKKEKKTERKNSLASLLCVCEKCESHEVSNCRYWIWIRYNNDIVAKCFSMCPSDLSTLEHNSVGTLHRLSATGYDNRKKYSVAQMWQNSFTLDRAHWQRMLFSHTIARPHTQFNNVQGPPGRATPAQMCRTTPKSSLDGFFRAKIQLLSLECDRTHLTSAQEIVW